ncbi:MAG: GAF domain-containing protein, partial [Flavobacteriaceae bacterium]|nr:GAF domain-containing protein [Flavobacteriaceae bacterium]
MDLNQENDMPMQFLISFDVLLRKYEAMAEGDDPLLAQRAKEVLKAQEPYPVLREGFIDPEILEKHKDVIQVILKDSFSEVLSDNEIKIASLPYFNIIFNASRRFQKILDNAGPDFELKIHNQEEKEAYIMGCTVILNFYYGFKLDFSRPLYYQIPDTNGVIRTYRILYNADFLEISPTEKTKELTQSDVDQLLEQPNNLELWKDKIPPDSFVTKGFVIANMFDVTTEHSISDIKTELIANNKRGSDTFIAQLEDIFQSFFKLKNLQVGFVTYDSKKSRFEKVYGKGIYSFLLQDREYAPCNKVLCPHSYEQLIGDSNYFVITDVDRHNEQSSGMSPYKELKEQGFKSAILAPIAPRNELLGVLEIVSTEKGVLNGVNATKLSDVMPYLESAVLRSKLEQENLIDAIIQHECTTVHPAVVWKFQEEAKKFIADELQERQPQFNEIVFKDVYPLFGQTDIRESSRARNTAIQRDLMIQLSEVNIVLRAAFEKYNLPIYEELMFRVNNHMEDIHEVLNTNSEQSIFDFVQEEINPVFEHLKKTDKEALDQIKKYEANIDSGTASYYDHRRNYDETVMSINKKLAGIIDRRQVQAQEMFPHYFERYKTDGVEHNMYIGQSIAETREFEPLYLNNLRLWQ